VQVSGLAGETVQDNELFQHYGWTSHAPAGTEAVVLPIGGNSSQGIIIATEHAQYRIKDLAAGEVAIYTDEGDSIVLKRGHLIEVTTQTLKINATTKVEMNTPLLQVNGGDVKADSISLVHHLHGNVQNGGSQTSAPV
jgi:phage baseplate assembly protein V